MVRGALISIGQQSTWVTNAEPTIAAPAPGPIAMGQENGAPAAARAATQAAAQAAALAAALAAQGAALAAALAAQGVWK